MQRSGHLSTLQQPPMILPKINHHVGGTIPDDTNIDRDRDKLNAYSSAVYWAGVNERKAAYRQKYAYPHDEERYFAEQVKSTLGIDGGRYVFYRVWQKSRED